MKQDSAVSGFLVDFLGVGAARVVAAAGGFAITLLLSRLLGDTPAERTANFGVYQIFFRTAGLIGVLGGCGWLAAGVLRYGTDEYVQTRALRTTFGVMIPIFLATNFVLVLAVCFFWDAICAYFEFPALLAGRAAFHLTWAYVVVFNLIIILPPFFQASRRMFWYGFLPVLPMMFYLPVLAVYGWSGRPLGPLTAVGWLLLLSLCMMLFAILRLLAFSAPPRWDSRRAREIVRYSYPIFFGALATQVILSFDQLALNKSTNDEGLVGVYSVAQLIFNNLTQISTVPIALLGPLIITMLVKRQEGEIGRFVSRVGPQIGWAWAALCGVAMLLAREVLLLYPGEFSAGGPILVVLLLAMALRVTALVDTSVFAAYGLMASTSVFAVLMALTQVACLAVLVPRYGMYGAAWAHTVTTVLGLFLRMVWLRYRLGYNTAPSLLPLWTLLFVWPVAFFVESWMLRLAALPLFLALHLGYGWAARLFSPDSLEIIERIRMPAGLLRTARRFYALMNRPAGSRRS